ncbi:MAG: hypothetical protein ABR562_04950 [Thermoplasmatota archaeon]|nr:hypothetical protein [Halobacteriales archaeon]
MAKEVRLVCSNCDERIVAVFVMVRKLKRSHASAACAYCGDTDSVTRAMNTSVDIEGRKQPLLLDVRQDA